MTHLSLFSGIGGADLAAEWAGLRTVAFCERDKFCQKVLRKHWPNVPIYEDIKEFSGEPFRGVTVLSGGFPCQPFSSAGKRKGAEDSRYLWPEMLRVITEARPTWVVGENVAGLLSLPELENILLSLEAEDYELWPIVLPACAVGAPHIRNRIFILAHSGGSDDFRRPVSENDGIREWELYTNERNNGNEVRGAASSRNSGIFGDSPDTPKPRAYTGESGLHAESSFETSWHRSWIEVASELCRVDDGLPPELDKGARLKALGNAIVPQQIYPIFKAIADIESGNSISKKEV